MSRGLLALWWTKSPDPEHEPWQVVSRSRGLFFGGWQTWVVWDGWMKKYYSYILNRKYIFKVLCLSIVMLVFVGGVFIFDIDSVSISHDLNQLENLWMTYQFDYDTSWLVERAGLEVCQGFRLTHVDRRTLWTSIWHRCPATSLKTHMIQRYWTTTTTTSSTSTSTLSTSTSNRVKSSLFFIRILCHLQTHMPHVCFI